MKVRNLLLAGLAAVAMTACSNNDEIVNNDNTQFTGEKANMRINFAFSDGTNTRSVTSDGTDAGDNIEWNAAKITVVLDYGSIENRIIKPNLSLIKNPGENNGTAKYGTPEFEVAAGLNVKIYTFINPGDLVIDETTNLESLKVGTQKLPNDGSLAYIAGTVAKSDNFLMSGSTTETINPGTTNRVSINVNRVAAKLDEKTDLSKDFELLDPNLVSNVNKISIKLLGYSFSNLPDNSYVLPNVMCGVDKYLQSYIPQGGTATDASYRWTTEQITYCLENFGNANPTRVHYKGQVYLDGKKANETFYIKATYNNDKKVLTLYKNWEALATAYEGLDNTKKDDDVYLKSIDVMKYNAGLCYYEAPIEDANEGNAVIRNNWYKLTVKSIKDLGTPTPSLPGPDQPSKLIIDTSIEPWTVHVNDYEL